MQTRTPHPKTPEEWVTLMPNGQPTRGPKSPHARMYSHGRDFARRRAAFPVKEVSGGLYGAMAAATAQVAAAAPRCAWPARPARPARERCPLACAGVASGGEGGQWEAALQLPAVDGCLEAPQSRCVVHCTFEPPQLLLLRVGPGCQLTRQTHCRVSARAQFLIFSTSAIRISRASSRPRFFASARSVDRLLSGKLA